jgi:hypothetical protein
MPALYTIIAILGWTALSSIIGSIVLIAVGKARGDEGEGIAARAQVRTEEGHRTALHERAQ